MNKVEVFNREISFIKNKRLQDNIKTIINLLPDYFFEIAASSTGKYHPRYALGDGGLVRHTKAAVRFAYELLENPVIGDKYTSDEKDIMIMAIIAHDGLKLGLDRAKYTKFDHPILIVDYVIENKDKLTLSDEELILFGNVIKSHMGNWNVDPYTKEAVLPKPQTKYENFVHMCDYLASRKTILFEFDENNNIIE